MCVGVIPLNSDFGDTDELQAIIKLIGRLLIDAIIVKIVCPFSDKRVVEPFLFDGTRRITSCFSALDAS